MAIDELSSGFPPATPAGLTVVTTTRPLVCKLLCFRRTFSIPTLRPPFPLLFSVLPDCRVEFLLHCTYSPFSRRNLQVWLRFAARTVSISLRQSEPLSQLDRQHISEHSAPAHHHSGTRKILADRTRTLPFKTILLARRTAHSAT